MAFFPEVFSNVTPRLTEITADLINNLEIKVGLNGSAAPASLDYGLRNILSVSPGHKHNVVDLYDGDDNDVLWRDPSDHLWKHVTPNSAGLMSLSGDQTVNGIKTFGSILILPSDNPTTDNQATRKAYVNAQISKAGIAGLVAGDMLYASAGDVLVALAKAAANNVMLSGDVPSWGKVGLTTHVDGILPVANGGTGQSALASVDHGVFGGLADDDHTQYLLCTGTRVLSITNDTVPQVALHGAIVGLRLEKDTSAQSASVEYWTDTVLKWRLGCGLAAGASNFRLHNGAISVFSVILPGAVVDTLYCLAGNVGMGVTAFGTSAERTFGMKSGVAPTTFPADMAQMCVIDQAAGNACFHFYSELGQIIKLYQQAHVADAKADYTAGDLDTEAEIITALNATNAKINTVLAYLENTGFNATA